MTSIDRRIQASRNKRLSRDSTKTTITPTTDKPTDKPFDAMDASIVEANKLWDDIKKRISDDPTFAKKPDNEKVEIYQKSKFKDFYTNFPIVCRYMICMGQFSNKAFKRFLLKCKSMHSQKSRGDTNAEDTWIQRQADYVRYLWESYQPQHFNTTDAQNIWQHAYKTLTQEFKDFKDMHKDAEKKLQVDEKSNKSELVKELIKRISNDEQSLDDTTTKTLIKKLEDQVSQQRKKKLMAQIKSDIETIPPSKVCRGSCKELSPESVLSKAV